MFSVLNVIRQLFWILAIEEDQNREIQTAIKEKNIKIIFRYL
jgi:hypothetical protein